MKKLIVLILMLTLAFCVYGTSAQDPAQTPADALSGGNVSSTEEADSDAPEIIVGTLSLLNMTEEERLAKEKGKLIAIRYLADHGAYHSQNSGAPRPVAGKVIFYDTLDAMLMALLAGDITLMEVPQCTADYLCSRDDRLMTRGSVDLSNADDFTKQVAYRLGVGFSFLTTEDKAELRDEVDSALTEMKADGTLDELIRTYINDGIDAEPEPAVFAQTDGETIRVAVTGALPPMDFVAADGTPAGFNTALLAELGKRLNKNIEIVVVDSVGRAAALASGQVNLVFWNNGADGRSQGGRQTAEEHAEHVKNELSENQLALMVAIGGGLDYEKNQNKDIPDGTITTQPYFSDLIIPVALK